MPGICRLVCALVKQTDMQVRAAAAEVLVDVCCRGVSLGNRLPLQLERVASGERPLLQELCYGVLRWQPALQLLSRQLVRRPLKVRDRDIHYLILLGLYQLIHMKIPPHAVVAETVQAVKALDKAWLAGMVNGVLRNFQRHRDELLSQMDQQEEGAFAHPRWMIEQIRAAWPDDWREILSANNQRPPMTVRVNKRLLTRAEYLERLAEHHLPARPTPCAESGVILAQPVAVDRLPGFREGHVSIQDGAAQLAAGLLDLRPGQRVLDACAAPGGKTCHILERQPALEEMVVIDISADRLRQIRENFQRLHLTATLLVGDAVCPDDWWDGQPFDRILLDAPCSATGVIRRHPDIKCLRRPGDLTAVMAQQARLLAALWPLLAVGGCLVYATCSILPQENSGQIAAFLHVHPDAEEDPVIAPWGHAVACGRQLLPGENDMDGFYYACLRKRPAHSGLAVG